MDEKIAAGDLENNPYTAETQWMLKGDLYKKLDDYPALLLEDEALSDFYDEVSSSLLADFKVIHDQKDGLLVLSEAVAAQWQDNLVQMEAVRMQLATAMEQLADENLTGAQQLAIVESVVGYRSTIASLAAWNKAAMATANADKLTAASSTETANATLATSELIEANQQAVNAVYLGTIAKDQTAFSTEQEATLLAIAEQCPMIGGNAVFTARALYALIDGEAAFDDATLCLPHGIVVKRANEPQPNTAKVMPNPASDQATLVLTKALAESGTLIVYNAVGLEVMRLRIPPDSPRVPFGTAQLAIGVYHYTLRSAESVIGEGKLSIVR